MPSIFQQVIAGASAGETLIPSIRAALWNPSFPSFEVNVEGFKPRPPDGWLHPSTHPLWPARQLYYYLAHPERLEAEPFDPTSTMAVTQGHFWHTFMGVVLRKAGIVLDVEVPIEHVDTRTRGNIDWLLVDEIGEFKTMRWFKMNKLVKGAPNDPAVVASFRQLVPDYYAQAQEYMRISGIHRWRGVILALEWPFEMREVAFSYDGPYATRIADKYRQVIQAVADNTPPEPCCAPGSKEAKACFARTVCPIGIAS